MSQQARAQVQPIPIKATGKWIANPMPARKIYINNRLDAFQNIDHRFKLIQKMIVASKMGIISQYPAWRYAVPKHAIAVKTRIGVMSEWIFMCFFYELDRL
jgi:hypothetical protein